MRSTDLTRLPVSAITKGLGAGNLKAADLVAALLERIAARGSLEAWVAIDRDQVLRAAKAADAGARRGPLAGVPVAVKDLMDTFDLPTAYGSPIYAGHRPRADAAFVAMLRSAGAIVLGKTVTTEFAFRNPAATRNPHNPSHTPGGSSSGSAAAVADFQVPLATGTQTAGSVIRPAAFCGVVGYKPTFGDLPIAGIKPCAPSLDTPGFLARSVEDVELARRVLIGGGNADRKSAPVIGLCRTASWKLAEPAAREALDNAVRTLSGRGARVVEVDLPEGDGDLLESHRIIMRYEMARSLADEVARSGDQISDTTREALEDGRRMSLEQYRAALAHAEVSRLALDRLFSGYDALLTLSTVGEAPRGLDSTGEPIFNSRWTMLHVPCITLPVGKGPAGLPLGIQLVGRRGRDASLLALASWAEGTLSAAGLKL